MAAGSTYVALATTTTTTSTASVTFSSISGAYTDLVLIANYGSDADGYISLQLNGDTTVANYSGTWLAGNGASASSGRYTGANGGLWLSMVNTVGSPIKTISKFEIMNYSNSTTYKTVLARNSMADTWAGAQVGLWRNTAAITSILITLISGVTYPSGCTFTLYGIAAA